MAVVRRGRSRFFRPAASGQVQAAVLLSICLYGVPFWGGHIVFPLGIGLPFLIMQEGLINSLPALGLLIGWTVLTWAAWLFFVRSRVWLRLLLAGPIAVVLTAGPLYWTFLGPQPPSLPEVAELRAPELGDWEEVCSLRGYEIPPQTSAAALEHGELWLRRDSSFFLLDPETCVARPATWVPRDATIADCGLEGRALWIRSGHLFFSHPKGQGPIALPPNRDLRSDLAKLSANGDWVAWVQDSPWELGVQRLGSDSARVVQLDLADKNRYSLRLLAYDPSTGEATLESKYNNLAVVNKQGRMTFGLFRPEECDARVSGNFFLHPLGWGFYGGGEDCELLWKLGPQHGFYNAKQHLGGLSERFASISSASVDPTGRFAGVISSVAMGDSQVHESAFVFRLEDGQELLRRHLPLDIYFYGQPVATFVGEGHFAISYRGTVRVFQVPAGS